MNPEDRNEPDADADEPREAAGRGDRARPRARRLYAPVEIAPAPTQGAGPPGLRGALEAALTEVTRVETAATILLVSTSGDEAASDQLDDLVASARRLRGALRKALEATP